jgi:23S rRNA pseudouridine1911/1915/1917 synthase
MPRSRHKSEQQNSGTGHRPVSGAPELRGSKPERAGVISHAPSHAEGEGDEVVGGSGGPDAVDLVLPGGKIDPDAIRRFVEEAQSAAASDSGEGESDDVLPRVTFTLRRDLQKRLDKYLTDRITFMSRSQLQRLIDEGGVTVNGRSPKASTVLRAGDVVEVLVPTPPSGEITPEDIALEVLFEDEHLIVLNKSPDIIVHPARSHNKGTMINALAYHFAHRSPRGGGLSGVGKDFARPGVVHRLDRHTSGVIVFAKQDEAHWKLGHQFEHRTVDKRYLAVVEGIIEADADVIDLPIGPHPSKEKGYREKYVVRHDEQGKNAVTICRVRERYFAESDSQGSEIAPARRAGLGWSEIGSALSNPGAGSASAGAAGMQAASPPGPSVGVANRGFMRTGKPGSRGYTLVELELKTGRTHQIRVHLSHLGYPIVGDDMYGGKPHADAAGATLIARQSLHACILGFTHPITQQRMVFTAPLRGDMSSLVRDLRATRRVERPAVMGTTVDLDRAVGDDR